MEEINEDLIIEKGLTVEIVETIKEEIIEEVVKNLDEVKLDDRNIHAPIILVASNTPKLIDFIGVDRFDSVRTYVFHLLRTYVILLCNWLIF